MALTNAAGDQFTLTFPEGAVLTDTTIRAIPIATSAGLPDGAGPISGLILQPDGLELARAATLEIVPKIAVPPESRLHWGFYGRGKDAFLHIPVQDTDAIVIPIDHFSGAGVGFADRVDLQLDRWRQSRIEDRVTTRIAEELRKDKLDLPDRDPNASFREIIAARAVAKEGRAAIVLHPAASCTDIKDAIRTIMQVVSRTNLLAADGGASDDGSSWTGSASTATWISRSRFRSVWSGPGGPTTSTTDLRARARRQTFASPMSMRPAGSLTAPASARR